jgi:hypothetical protein
MQEATTILEVRMFIVDAGLTSVKRSGDNLSKCEYARQSEMFPSAFTEVVSASSRETPAERIRLTAGRAAAANLFDAAAGRRLR